MKRDNVIAMLNNVKRRRFREGSSSSAPLWLPAGALAALDMAGARDWAIGYSFSRASAAWTTTGAATYDTLAVNEMRWTPGAGAILLPATTRVSAAPLDIVSASWAAQGGTAPVVTTLPSIGDYPTPARIASDGNAFARRNSAVFSLTSGDVIRCRVLYRAGTSPNFGLYVHHTAGASASSLIGAVGALASTGVMAGAWSDIVNTDLGGGFYLVEATLTANATEATYQIGVSPRSSTAGQYVDVLAAAALTGPARPEWAFGSGATQTVAADVLTLKPKVAGELDWFARFGNGSTQQIASGVEGDVVVDAATLNRRDVAMIWAEAA